MTHIHYEPEEYQYVRFNEQLLPGQFCKIRNLCLSRDQGLEIRGDSEAISFLLQDQTRISSGISVLGTGDWYLVGETDGVEFRQYNLFVSNLSSNVATFSVAYSCFNLIIDPGPTYAYPTSDLSSSTPWRCYQGGSYQGDGIVCYFRVHDEYPGWDDLSYIELQTNAAGQNIYFGFTTFFIYQRFVIDSVKIYYRVKSNSPAEIRSGVICGGTTYDSIDPGVTVTQTWTTYSYQYFRNPSSGVNWVVDDFNGESAHALSGFGLDVISGDDINVSQCFLEVVSAVPLSHGQHTLYLYPTSDFGNDGLTWWYRNPPGDYHYPPYWDKVDDPVGSSDLDQTMVYHGSSSGSGYISFTFDAPSTTNWVSVQRVTVRYRVFTDNETVVKATVSTGGVNPIEATLWDDVDPGATWEGWEDHYYTFLVNPATGVAWTPEDIGKIGTDYLAGFGLSTTIGNFNLTQCYLEIVYTT